MCTAISIHGKDHYFGRNLDLEYHFNEEVVVLPRNFPLYFRETTLLKSHFAIMGIATVAEDYPLFYDAVNEFGLCMAGLNFPGNASYKEKVSNSTNITPFELIPYILGQCRTVQQAHSLISGINISNLAFSESFPLTPLHWIISDRENSIVIEPMKDGIHIHDNPIGVLSNNPPFDYHLYNMANYMNLSSSEPANRISDNILLKPYSRGMAAIGLPGDLSSASRFVRAAFMKLNAEIYDQEKENVAQFFHLLASVEQQAGCVRVANGNVSTVYSGCCNATKGIYYYRTYFNSRITSVDMHAKNLNGDQLYRYPMRFEADIYYENKNQRM